MGHYSDCRTVGRPRLGGERYACGKLKPGPLEALSAAVQSAVTAERTTAACRFARECERSLRDGHGEGRLIAAQAHRAARSCLTPAQDALAKLVILRGQAVATVATKAGREPADLIALLEATCDALADHYAAVDKRKAA